MFKEFIIYFAKIVWKICYKIRGWHWSWSIYSKNIVEAHGGSIKGYNNSDGKGATLNLLFQLKIPKINNKFGFSRY